MVKVRPIKGGHEFHLRVKLIPARLGYDVRSTVRCKNMSASVLLLNQRLEEDWEQAVEEESE